MDFKDANSGLLVPKHYIEIKGHYEATILRAGEVIDEFEFDNVVVNEGLNATLNAMLAGGPQYTSWFLGLFTGNYTPIATDTAATIAGNSTEATGYTAAARQQWLPAAPSAQAVTNAASRASFTFNATQSIYGAFLVSSATINGTSGVLFGAAQFGTPKSVVNADQLLLTYTASVSST
jgi:hypothetical protein